MENKINIRNSTVDFLVFTKESGHDTLEVRVQDENVWLTQEGIASLFDIERSVVTKHLKNIYEEKELVESSTCANFAQVASTKEFFATVQNKLHYAITHQTAAEIVFFRSDSTKPNMGLKTWKSAPKGKIVKSDVSVAKNYLEKNEMSELNEIVEMYLDFATRQARKKIPMTMEDWAKKLDVFLKAGDEDILTVKGKITHELAKEKAETEFEKYRLIQDKKYKSDFDLFLEQAANLTENKK